MFFLKRLIIAIISLIFTTTTVLSEKQYDKFERYELQSESAKTISNIITKFSINPVVDAMKRMTIDDQEMQKLLSRVAFTSTPHIMRKGNAYSILRTGSKGRESVEVDPGWVQQALSVGSIVGVRIADPVNAGDILHRFGSDYFINNSSSLKNGTILLPNLSFDITDYISDPYKLSVAQGVGYRVASEIMAWTVLHEIAHHKLGHLVHKMSNPSAINTELEADNWAFNKMQDIGIPLYGVMSFMQVMNVFDRIHSISNQDNKLVNNTHPSWENRLSRLLASHDPMKVSTRFKITTFMSKLSFPRLNEPSSIKLVAYIFTQDPVDLSCTGALFITGNPVEILISEKRGDSIHLLQQTLDESIDIKIINPHYTISKVITTVTNRKTGVKKLINVIAWEQSLVLFSELEKEGVRVGDAMQISSRVFFKDMLKLTISDPELIKQAINVSEQNLKSQCAVRQRFGRGEISLNEMNKLSLSANKTYENNLISVIGNSNYARLNSKIMASSYTKAGLKYFKSQ